MRKTSVSRDPGIAAPRLEYPLSTNVSSPVQAVSKRRSRLRAQGRPEVDVRSNSYFQDDLVVSDNESEYKELDDQSDAASELSLRVGKPRELRRRRLGPPITTDEKLERLNSIHQMVIEEFMHHAIGLSRKVCSPKAQKSP